MPITISSSGMFISSAANFPRRRNVTAPRSNGIRNDVDTRAHLGQCLLRLNRPAEARPLLEGVMREKPEHDYGHTMMALAETLAALGEKDNALLYWQHIVQNHSYPRAKVQLAELYAAQNQPAAARAELKDVLNDDPHAPAYQRRRDRVWVSRAKKLVRQLA